MTNRTGVVLFSFVLSMVAACKCGGGIQGLNESLISPGWDAGSLPVGDAVRGVAPLNDNGSAIVTIEGLSIIDDAGAFSLDDGGQVKVSTQIGISQTLNLGLRYKPNRVGPQIATVNVETDNGTLYVPLWGDGINLCAKIGCDAGMDTCAGQCVNGACQYPGNSTSCTDGRQCIQNGSCDGAGHCAGPSACVPTGSCDAGDSFSGQIATNPDGTGTCVGSATASGTFQCQYNSENVHCDCGCGITPAGNPGCLYSWALDNSAPDGSFGSVWSDSNGDLWASSAVSHGVQPQNVWQKPSGGSWAFLATIPLGGNGVCAGSGCSTSLVGDTQGDLYGAYQCVAVNGTTCADAGMWKYSNGSATFEPFVPSYYSLGCGNNVNISQTYPVMLGPTPAVMDADPCGPNLSTEQNGTFAVFGGEHLPVNCSATGAIWGVDAGEYFVAWGCSAAGPGGIWQFNGGNYGSQLSFAQTDSASAMAGTSTADIWAVGTQRWHYDGAAWTAAPVADGGSQQGAGTQFVLPDTSLWSVGNGDYFATGDYSGVYHYAASANGGSDAWTLECLAPGYAGHDPAAQQIAGVPGNLYAGTTKGLFQRVP